jgi:Ankyrin repeats (3 copies)
VRRTLDELPESLDKTYERVLKEIKKPNRDHAHRLLQCLVVAIRPLRVEELAEVLAVDFGGTEEFPKLNPNWRWEDEEQVLLASCSSLISIIESDGLRVVQFSHFSVREFLTSTRLATSSGEISRYHIVLEPAHTILAQACLSVLLRSDNRDEQSGDGKGNNSPLARYAAEHWAAQSQFEQVSSYLRTSMEKLFDLDKPYFAAWCELYDIDTSPPSESSFYMFALTRSSNRGTPLYYAALCGFQNLVQYLISKYPQHVNASGGYYVRPLVAALAGKHLRTAELLHHSGADPNVHGFGGDTPLHSASFIGDVEMVQVLLNCGADVNIRNDTGETPLDHASIGDSDKARDEIMKLLSERGAE